MTDDDQAHDACRVVHEFFAAFAAGDLPDRLLTPDMTAWTTTHGVIDKRAYQGFVRSRAAIVAGPLGFTVDRVAARNARIFARACVQGRLSTAPPMPIAMPLCCGCATGGAPLIARLQQAQAQQ